MWLGCRCSGLSEEPGLSGSDAVNLVLINNLHNAKKEYLYQLSNTLSYTLCDWTSHSSLFSICSCPE